MGQEVWRVEIPGNGAHLIVGSWGVVSVNSNRPSAGDGEPSMQAL